MGKSFKLEDKRSTSSCIDKEKLSFLFDFGLFIEGVARFHQDLSRLLNIKLHLDDNSIFGLFYFNLAQSSQWSSPKKFLKVNIETLVVFKTGVNINHPLKCKDNKSIVIKGPTILFLDIAMELIGIVWIVDV